MTKERAEYLQREITFVKTRIDKLLDTFIDGNISKEIYDKKYNDLNSKLEKLEEQVELNDMNDKNFIN